MYTSDYKSMSLAISLWSSASPPTMVDSGQGLQGIGQSSGAPRFLSSQGRCLWSIVPTAPGIEGSARFDASSSNNECCAMHHMTTVSRGMFRHCLLHGWLFRWRPPFTTLHSHFVLFHVPAEDKGCNWASPGTCFPILETPNSDALSTRCFPSAKRRRHRFPWACTMV